MPTAVIDLTVLSTPTVGRGIGRYVADLAYAVAGRSFAGGRASSAPTPSAVHAFGLNVRAVERLDWTRPATIDDDPGEAAARLTTASRRIAHAAWAHRVRFRLAAAARRAGADVLHSPHPGATPLGAPGCPRIVTCHDLIGLRFPERYATWRDGWRHGRHWLDRRRYSSARHIIAVSEATAHDLVSILRVPDEKITVVRHGIDLTRFSHAATDDDVAVRERHGLADRPYLLYVGAGDWRKNPDGMLAALEIVRRRCGGDGPLLAWAGRLDPGHVAVLRRLVADRRIGNALRLLGWIPDTDLAALMRGAVALLFVSRIEGFGYPLVEAMASGCPLIASDRPATVEMAGDAALLVDPERPGAIADAALMLLRDAGERRRLIERGLVRCRAFDVRRMADETLAVYRRVAGSATIVRT